MNQLLKSYPNSIVDPGYENGITMEIYHKILLTDCNGYDAWKDASVTSIDGTNPISGVTFQVNSYATWLSGGGNTGWLFASAGDIDVDHSDTERFECIENPDINTTGLYIELIINGLHRVPFTITGIPLDTATYKYQSVQGAYGLWYTLEANWYFHMYFMRAWNSVSLGPCTFGWDNNGLKIYVTDHEFTS